MLDYRLLVFFLLSYPPLSNQLPPQIKSYRSTVCEIAFEFPRNSQIIAILTKPVHPGEQIPTPAQPAMITESTEAKSAAAGKNRMSEPEPGCWIWSRDLPQSTCGSSSVYSSQSSVSGLERVISYQANNG